MSNVCNMSIMGVRVSSRWGSSLYKIKNIRTVVDTHVTHVTVVTATGLCTVLRYRLNRYRLYCITGGF